jgi:hypothetical protein
MHARILTRMEISEGGHDMKSTKPASRLAAVIMPRLRAGAAAILVCAAGTAAGAAEDDGTAILKAMADYLAAQQTISFTFDSAIEVITPQMEKIQFTNSGEALLSRPDKLRAHRVGGYSDVELVFDGKTISIHDRGGNGYAQVEAPGTVDQLIATLRAGHGIALPGADLLLTNAYDVLVADVTEAKHIGRGVVGGRECEHLAFRNFDTDWQIWVETGDRPMPCKIVISSKTVAGAPQYTLRVTGWQTGVEVASDAFAFVPPAGAALLDSNALIHLDELPQPAEDGGNQ